MKRTTIFKSFSLLAILTIFEKIIAFVFEAIIAATLGSNAITDAYFSASEIIGVIDTAFLSSLTVVALNRYSHYSGIGGDEKAFASMSKLRAFYLPIMVGLSVLIFALATPISYIVAPGYDVEARDMLVLCIRIMSATPVVSCIMSIDLAVLRNKKHFTITGLKSLFISVFGMLGIAAYVIWGGNGAYLLSAAFIVSMIAFCVLTSVSILKYGRLRICRPHFDDDTKKSVLMLLPLMASYGIDRVALMVGKTVSSTLGEGYVSSLTYAHSLYKVVAAVFITNLATVLLTDFNELFSQSKNEAVAQKIKSVASVMTAILLPITIISIVCSEDVVKIVYERGSFNSNATILVASVLAVYAINFVPAMLHGLYNQVLYAKGDTKSPMWIALISIAVNLGVSFGLVGVIGLPGVAVGTLVSSIIAVIIAGFIARGHLSSFRGCYSLRFVLNSVISGALCAGVIILIKQLALGALITFAVSAVGGFGVFFGVMLLLRDETMLGMAKKAIAFFKRKSNKT